MKKFYGLIVAAIVLTVLLFVTGTVYTVREDQQVILTQFGKPVGDPVSDAGLHFKMPFVQKVNIVEKRVLAWDGQSSRLDDILGSETRNAVANHDLIEVVRSTKDRVPDTAGLQEDEAIEFESIKTGRREIEKKVFETAKAKLEDFGINLLDLRFKRINYNNEVAPQIFQRMISERQQIAERFRSEGAGEAARIKGKMEREVKKIESESYAKVQSILGQADAESTRIYAEAFGGTPEREAFYEFVKTLEAYDKILDENTTVILSTESELFRLLKGKGE